MASQERQHDDDADRVLIRPSACSTFVVKKSSVGHVPHEPSKGAVGRDVCHSAVPAGTSTAAHGSHRINCRASESKQKHSLLPSELAAVSSVVQKGGMRSSLTSQKPVSDVTVNSVGRSTVVDSYKASASHLSCADIAETLTSVCLDESLSSVSLRHLVGDSSSRLFSHSSVTNTASVNTTNSVPESTVETVKMLQTEVVSLKEQLVVQSKVNADLKKLLVASIGDDLHHKVDTLVRTKIQLANEIDDYTKKLLEDYEDLDKLSIQADIWHSKYKASRVLVEQMTAEKRQLNAAYNDALTALRQMLADSREIQTLLMHMNTTLEALRSHVAVQGGDSGPHLTTARLSSLELVRLNRRIVDEVCVAVLRTLPSHSPLISSHSCLSPSEVLAYKVLNDCSQLNVSRSSEFVSFDGNDRHLSLQLRFNSCTRYDGVTFNCCRKCHGEVHVV